MMRPATRIWIAAPLAAAALALSTSGPAKAGAPGTGIVVNSGTVQQAGDPHWLYLFNVSFAPDPALHDFIHTGDNFTVTFANNTGVLSGTNGQPPDWAATSFSADSVTWSYIGSDDITAGLPLDPAPGPFFEVESSQFSDGTFTYSFNDSLPKDPGGNSGGGSFIVTAVPEPSSVALVVLGASLAFCMARRSRRRAALA